MISGFIKDKLRAGALTYVTFLSIVFLIFTFSNISQAQWITKGNAVSYPENQGGYKVGKELIVTKEIRAQKSAVWKADKMNMFRNFEMRLKAYFGDSDGGADGMALVLHNNVDGVNALGDDAQGGSAMGASNIEHSVVIEFDTHDNGTDIGDLSQDHLAFYKHGKFNNSNLLKSAEAFQWGNIENNQWYDIQLLWNYNERLLTVNVINEAGNKQVFTYRFFDKSSVEDEIIKYDLFLDNFIKEKGYGNKEAEAVMAEISNKLILHDEDEYQVLFSKQKGYYWTNNYEDFKNHLSDDNGDEFVDTIDKEIDVKRGRLGLSTEKLKETNLYTKNVESLTTYAVIDYYLSKIDELNQTSSANSIEDIFSRGNSEWNGEIIAGFTASTGDNYNVHKFKELYVDYSDLKVKLDNSGADDYYNTFLTNNTEVNLTNGSKVSYDPALQKLVGVQMKLLNPIKDTNGNLQESLIFNGNKKLFNMAYDDKNGILTLTAKNNITDFDLQDAIDQTVYLTKEVNLSPKQREVEVVIKGEIIKATEGLVVGQIVQSPEVYAKLSVPYIDLNGDLEEGYNYFAQAEPKVSIGTNNLKINLPSEGVKVKEIKIEALNFKTGDKFTKTNTNNITFSISQDIVTITAKNNKTTITDFENALKAISYSIADKSEDRLLQTSLLLDNGTSIQYVYSNYFFYKIDLDATQAGYDFETQIDYQSELLPIANSILFSPKPEMDPTLSFSVVLENKKDLSERLLITGVDENIESGYLLGGKIQYHFKNNFTELYFEVVEVKGVLPTWEEIQSNFDRIKYTHKGINPSEEVRLVKVSCWEYDFEVAYAYANIKIGYHKLRLTIPETIWDYDIQTTIDLKGEGYVYQDPISLFKHTNLSLQLYENYETSISIPSILIYTGKLQENDLLSIDGEVYDMYNDKDGVDQTNIPLSDLLGENLGVVSSTTSSSDLLITRYAKGFKIAYKNGASIQKETELKDILSRIMLVLPNDLSEEYIQKSRQIIVQLNGNLEGADYEVDSNVLYNNIIFENYMDILPITLAEFKVERIEDKVVLNWVTLSEFNNDYFEIQRSIDGVNYLTIGAKKGQLESNSIMGYTFEDVTAPNAELHYRLKQVDLRGKVTYYTAYLDSRLTTAFELELLSENPVISSEVALGVHISQKQKCIISIYNLTGNIIHHEELLLEKGFNRENIRLRSRVSGIYILDVQTAHGHREQIKLQIQ